MCCIRAVVVSLLIASSAAAQDWPRFRGVNGAGVSTDVLPTRWTDKDYRWQVKLPGPGHSSPIVWGDRVIVTSEAGGKLHVLCLDANSGKAIWIRDFQAAPRAGHKDNNLASSTPAADDKHVYIAWGSPKEVVLLALSHEGKDVWRRELGSYKAGHGFGASPIVHDGLVALPCEQDNRDCLVAVDAGTGKDRWRVARKSRNTYATPCIFQPKGHAAELIAVSYEDGITSHDPATGKVNWSMDVFDKRHVEGAIASPIVHGDLVLGTAGWLGVRFETIALRPDRRAEARKGPVEVYKIDRGAPLVPTPVALADLLFLWDDKGIVSCANARTGENHWRERVDGSFYASPVIAGAYLYCPSREGDLFVLSASKKFDLVARVPLGEGTHATPAIAGGRMFLRTATRLLCVAATR
jgi:outer membrane protein assembly factor BamB